MGERQRRRELHSRDMEYKWGVGDDLALLSFCSSATPPGQISVAPMPQAMGFLHMRKCKWL